MKRIVMLIGLLLLLTMPAFAETLSSWEDIEQEFVQAAEGRSREITFRVDHNILKEIEADSNRFYIHAGKAGIRRLSFIYWTDGRIEVSQIEYFSCPYLTVENETELLNAVRAMKKAGADRFVLMLEPKLYAAVQRDSDLKRSIFLKGGLLQWGMEYYSDDQYRLEYEDCTYWDGAVLEITDDSALASKIQQIGDQGYDDFALLAPKELFSRLTAHDHDLLHAVEAAACINHGATTYQGERMLLYYESGQSVFYPGYVILRASLNGQEALLTKRFQDTLRSARRMTSNISGTREEMVLAIHDLLCQHIKYKIDDSTDEDDCCIGAIMNGAANCDGYSDAFYLLCGLKGIPVRLVTGDALKQLDPGEDPFHMWNLVQLNGQWLGVDVTWDDPDRGEEISYGQYLMGMDLMEENYRFHQEFLPSGIPGETARDKRPVPEFSVFTVDEVISCLRKAATEGKKRVILRMSESLFGEYASQANPIWKWFDLAGVSGSTSYSAEDRTVFISDISELPAGIVVFQADSKNKLISRLKQVTQSAAREVRVYCSADLFAEYMADQQKIWTWLREGGIPNASVSYYTERKMFLIKDF